MLRHYDAIGLLRPTAVDPSSGYRWYEAGQLSELNRIVALKDLGFTLAQVQSILDDKVSVDELRGMLRLRQAELGSQLAIDADRLAQVETRLQMIETEGAMPADDVQIKSVPAIRVAELTGVAAGFEPQSISPVIAPLYEELCARLDAADVTPIGPALAYYEDCPEGVLVHAAMPVEPATAPGVTIVDLPALEQAATIVHRGPMEEVMKTIQTLARWIEANGFRSVGYNRELYLDTSSEVWVTELQEPVTRTS